MQALEELLPPELEQPDNLERINRKLEGLSPERRIEWALHYLPGNAVLTSSFGIQAALMLHLVTQVRGNIPVVLVDTGYLFQETYGFVDELTARLDLNLHVYRAALSPSWQEARYGQLWEQGLSGIEHYNRLNKVEPLQRALKELDAGSWLSGLRRDQAESRAALPIVRIQNGRFKIHPVIDWNNREVHRYLRQHQLPYHPLWDRGYVSVGDTHTTRPLEAGMSAEDTRFFGLKRECGIHD